MQSQTRRATKPTPEEAETLALRALAYIAADPEQLGRFLAQTGLGPENLRQAAQDTAFLPAILDYLMANEPLLLDFASSHALDPDDVATARAVLRGHERDGWLPG